MRFSQFLYWYKPKGDVYRSSIQPWTFPWQGISLYDSWMPHEYANLTFWDYPGKDGDATRHAIGAHISNKHKMAIQNVYMRNFKVLLDDQNCNKNNKIIHIIIDYNY